MKKYTLIIIALILILIPPIGRYFWFYQGFYQRQQPVSTPNYSALAIPEPPISTLPAPIRGDALENYTVLVDFEHSNSFVLSEIENLTQSITRRGVKLEVSNFNLSLDERLKYCDAYIVIAPTYSFSDNEIRAVQRFVNRGGRLLVIADPTRNYFSTDPYSYDPGAKYLSGVDVANLLLAPFEIAFNEDYVYNLVENEANYRNVFFENFSKNAITHDLSRIALYGAHSIHTTQEILIYGDKNTLSSSTDQGGKLAVAAAAANGNVLAIGDLNFLTVPYHQVEDNFLFLSNLVDYLLGAQRSYDLADFPYLFRLTVNILTPSGDVMDKDFITTLSDIQYSLKELDLSIIVSQKAEDGQDLLVTGTYSQRDELNDYLEPFKLEFSREPIKKETAVGSIFDTPPPTPSPIPTEYWSIDQYSNMQDAVKVPGLGKFNIKDVGLILFSSSAERNTLILLASNTEAIRELSDIVFRYRNLSTCLTTDTIAVCSLFSGDSESDYSFDFDDFSSDNETEDEYYQTESTPQPWETGSPIPEVTPLGSR